MHVREFIKTTFSKVIKQTLQGPIDDAQDEATEHLYSNKDLYFTFGCLLKPKQMIRYIELDQEKVESALSVTRRKGCSITKQISQLSNDDLQSLDSSRDVSSESQLTKEKSKKRRKANIYDYMNIDFLGVLKDNSIEMRKSKILEVYRSFFRLTVRSMRKLIDSPMMMVVVLEYLR